MCVCMYVCVCVCVCVFVCVKYVLSTIYLLHFISDPVFLRIPVPVYIPAIRQLRCLPCYMPISVNPLSQVSGVALSRPSCYLSPNLSTPGRDQCNYCSIRQICSLPDARPFVARSAEKQAVRPHYCWRHPRPHKPTHF